jgi:hypothetical protein
MRRQGPVICHIRHQNLAASSLRFRNTEHFKATTGMTKLSVCVASMATFNHRSPGRQAQSPSAFNLIDSRYREVAAKQNWLPVLRFYPDFSSLKWTYGKF